jgi:hypothetical protein
MFTEDGNGKKESLFSAYIPEEKDRDALWDEIKSKKVNGRTCHVFDNEEEYMDFFGNLLNM